LQSAKNYVVMDDKTGEIRVLPQAQTALTVSTYDELTRLTAALNAADADLRTPQAQQSLARLQSSTVVKPASACTNKFHFYCGRLINDSWG
jgi:hypothetical protein